MIWYRAAWNCQTHFLLPESVLFLLKENNDCIIWPKSALVFSLKPVGAWFSPGQGCEHGAMQCTFHQVHFDKKALNTALHHHCIYHKLFVGRGIADYTFSVYILRIYHLKHNTALSFCDCVWVRGLIRIREAVHVWNMCFSLGFIEFHLPSWARFSPLKPLGLCAKGDMRQVWKIDCSNITDAKRTVMLLTAYMTEWMTGNRSVGTVPIIFWPPTIVFLI